LALLRQSYQTMSHADNLRWQIRIRHIMEYFQVRFEKTANSPE